MRQRALLHNVVEGENIRSNILRGDYFMRRSGELEKLNAEHRTGHRNGLRHAEKNKKQKCELQRNGKEEAEIYT